MDDLSFSPTTFIIVLLVLFTLFVTLFILFFALSSPGSTIALVLAIIFFLLFVALLVYFLFFATFPSTDGNNNGGNNNGGGTGPPAPTGGTGPPDTFVRFGDIVQLNNFNLGGYASPCGSVGGCSNNAVSMRTDSSFNQDNGVATGLRQWQVTGGPTGNGVSYTNSRTQSIIRLISVTSSSACDNCSGNPLSLCENADVVQPVAVVSSDVVNNSDMWLLQKDPSNVTTNTGVTYGALFNLRSLNSLVSPSEEAFLSICTSGLCNNASGDGCGNVLTTLSLAASDPVIDPSLNLSWSFTRPQT